MLSVFSRELVELADELRAQQTELVELMSGPLLQNAVFRWRSRGVEEAVVLTGGNACMCLLLSKLAAR